VVPEGPAKPAAIASAALLTAFAPLSMFFSSVGFLDHHIAETLMALLLAGWALRRYPGPGASWERSPIAWEVAGALAATVSLWVFAGGILYVALAGALVGARILAEERPRLVGSGAPGLAVAAAVSALLALPAVGAHGRALSYQLPSFLHPLLLGVGAAGLALAVFAARITRRPLARVGLLLAGALAVAALATLSAGAWREIRTGLEGWLLKKDPWIANIAEFQPLGGQERTFLLALFQQFGAIGVGAPLILLAGAAVMVRVARGRGLAFVALTAALALLTLNQIRFGRVGVPLLMIHLAAVLAAFAHRRRKAQHLWGIRVFPALVALVLLFADPMLRPVGKMYAQFSPFVSAALDLRVAARGDRTSGVLTQWDAGHLVAFASGLPTVTNGFGAYVGESVFKEAEASFGGTPEALDAFLARRRVRYVIAGGMSEPLLAVSGHAPFVRATDAKGAILDLEYMKSFGNAPLVIGGSGIPGAEVRHLEHLLPISSTPQQPPGMNFPLPALWVYERVPGARLSGRAPPRARVLATLDFKEQARPHVWRAFADAGEEGRFELVVPFPSGFLRPAIWSAQRWVLRTGDGPPIAVEVPEAAVRGGEIVQVGEVRPALPVAPRTRKRGSPDPRAG
jgi:hypothetical protein